MTYADLRHYMQANKITRRYMCELMGCSMRTLERRLYEEQSKKLSRLQVLGLQQLRRNKEEQ